jgi:CxxC motif-containing protein
MDIEKKHFTCVTCPVGCEVDVELRDGNIVSMKGNRCDKVKEFVLQELKEPVRVLTTTVRIEGAKWAMLPVRTDKTIPKRLFLQAIGELASINLKAPVHMSEVIVRDIAGSGANIVATRTMKRRSMQQSAISTQ